MRALAEAIDKGLRNISSFIVPVVFSYINETLSARSDHHVDDPEAFDGGLEEIF
jgi:hypothetical protein